MARKYRQINDAELLKLAKSGRIVLNGRGVEMVRRGRLQPLTKYADANGRLYVRIYHNKGRRGIMLGKLVWMIANLSAVPDGFDVHHIDENKLNDQAGNLAAIPVAVNRAKRTLTEKELAIVLDFIGS